MFGLGRILTFFSELLTSFGQWVVRNLITGLKVRIVRAFKKFGWWLLYALGGFIDFIVGFFTGGNVINFFFTLKISVVNSIIFGIWVTLFTTYVASIIFIFRHAVDLINKINSASSNHVDPDNLEILSLSFDILKALGIWDAFVDVFATSIPFWFSIIMMYSSKVFLKALYALRKNLLSLHQVKPTYLGEIKKPKSKK